MNSIDKTILSYKDYQIYDIKNDSSIRQLWQEYIKSLDSNDRLIKNYKEIDLTQFICFNVLMYKNNIVAFSGLQYRPDRWNSKIARCMSRFYINPEFRHKKGLFNDFLFSEVLIPEQIFQAINHELDMIFISRESGRKSFAEYIKYLNTKNLYFEFEKERYNVCGCMNQIPKSCIQYVASLNLKSKLSWNDLMRNYVVI